VNAYVADASVAAKWVLPGSGEPLRDEALHLLSQWIAGNCLLTVPDIFWSESANILWKAFRRGRCSEETARASLIALQELEIPTVSAFALLDSALGIAISHARTVYDAVYVALAVKSKAQLVTADEKLANALAAHLPVKWLGAI
jgi:predicted nucleic acid-binding protein